MTEAVYGSRNPPRKDRRRKSLSLGGDCDDDFVAAGGNGPDFVFTSERVGCELGAGNITRLVEEPPVAENAEYHRAFYRGNSRVESEFHINAPLGGAGGKTARAAHTHTRLHIIIDVNDRFVNRFTPFFDDLQNLTKHRFSARKTDKTTKKRRRRF